ncbi:MAG TPA: UDP-3-O-acyl-N-acetylglucosamine deacetylase [Candidatus Eisenbacteria bacterium]|jgi:UDP-3-O-acyl N-acetylglucosamine deacetylase|nr:UDP-3-O-acyl-N-acetylglucosamine deacetylase [Candidatus Eisenbacteria bacterium]
MSLPAQKTVLRAGSLSGIGLHTGREATVRVEPAPADHGVRFFKRGREASGGESVSRCTSVGAGEDRIQTVEHLCAALSGLGVTNAAVHVEGDEIPVLDGSAAPFVEFLKGLGLAEQEKAAPAHRITEPIFCHEGKAALCAYPAETFRAAYTLDYDHPLLSSQTVQFALTPEVFEREIAPARTFCTQEEAARLKEAGFGLGGNTDNTLVMSASGPVKNRLRFEDECARHKVLDLLGDLSLLGFGILGTVVGLRSGHALNRRLVEAIRRQKIDGRI